MRASHKYVDWKSEARRRVEEHGGLYCCGDVVLNVNAVTNPS